MIKSIFYYKELSSAEVGKTKTHEVYVRMPNNFDHDEFFGNIITQNNSVFEVNFNAQDITEGANETVSLRYVYYANSPSKEKRIPGLSPLFRKHSVQEGDIVCLESRKYESSITHYIRFYKKGEIQISPSSIYFSKFDDREIELNPTKIIPSQPLQQIFYGAPGTGKSHTINEITEQQPQENVFRTTFHPDSDYSTFVGCYKPCMINKEPLYKVGELINKLSEIKNSGVTYPCHKFAAKYWESLKDLSTEDIKKILTSCSFTESMNVEISKGVAIGEDLAKKTDNHKIVYSFVPQAFTKAYLRAWQTTDPVYLVIEEINRGNCAQIFGDLFQLLDRKNGVSEYPIKPDDDLGRFIAENLTNPVEGIPDEIRVGKELSLPANLYIWATMNTSDQSLFPIDSAFKRRWEWKYIPIGYKNEDWVIEIGEKKYKWVDFQRTINDKIYNIDNSEDKQLGDFFVDANQTGKVISADTLLNKILFYIWNDVCKDDPDQIFRWIDYKDKKEKSIRFSDFFTDDKDKKLQGLMSFLGIKAEGETEEEKPVILPDVEESDTDVAPKESVGE